ncbi:MAG: ferritin-like domain-containing protein [Citrobacter freundii]|nr:MAG: ferritin-like domain-containing protein [Citrobacter freundii]
MANTKAAAKKTAKKKTQQQPAGAGAGNTQLEKLFHDSVKDIYWAEKALTKALKKMMKNATTEELQSAIEEHISQTEGQVGRLEQVFEKLGKKPQAKKCEAMEGLIKEGESIIEETEDGSMTRDVGIIMAAQKVEHYEIATYGSLVQLAYTMGQDEIASILQETLDEEKQTDENLTQIAENNINWEAESEDGGEDQEEEDENEEEDA